MAFGSFDPESGSGRRPMMSDINVTPMVDVMLVLLIIFMVAAPMMTQGLDVDLPRVDTSALQTEEQQTVLTIRVSGEVFLDDFPVTGENLAYQVHQVMETKGSKTVFIRADRQTYYGDVARVMGELQKAGITSLGLVTDPLDSAFPAAREEQSAPPAAR